MLDMSKAQIKIGVNILTDRNLTIGARVKNLRTTRKYTLKRLSEEVGLSIGFLSQLERGMSSIAIDSLSKIADVFDVPLSSFFVHTETSSTSPLMKSYDAVPSQVSPEITQYILSNDPIEYEALPRLIVLMPACETTETRLAYSHQGEEFYYVLEGIVTVELDRQEYTLYPGDSMQIHSTSEHNWYNRTNRVAKFIQVNCPNPFRQPELAKPTLTESVIPTEPDKK